jgi:hypothetical protein
MAFRNGNRFRGTAKRRQAVLDLLAKGNGYEQAARAVGVSGGTLRNWRHDDPDFAAACEAACDYIGDIAESVLLGRGLKGDTLALLAWLRAHRPQLYYRKMLVVGDPDSPINVDHQHQHSVGQVRLVVLPDNGRPALSEAEMIAERERVARESMVQIEIDGAASPPTIEAVIENKPDEAGVAEWPQQIILKRRS